MLRLPKSIWNEYKIKCFNKIHTKRFFRKNNIISYGTIMVLKIVSFLWRHFLNINDIKCNDITNDAKSIHWPHIIIFVLSSLNVTSFFLNFSVFLCLSAANCCKPTKRRLNYYLKIYTQRKCIVHKHIFKTDFGGIWIRII